MESTKRRYFPDEFKRLRDGAPRRSRPESAELTHPAAQLGLVNTELDTRKNLPFSAGL